ncbi:MAG TPA: hypothetical protein DCY27_06085 [Desulfobacterales bacterium]|nr:hypothetical protein [Desulfobacterales bacterium]
MAKKDTTSNWWKQVVERRKGQATEEEPPAEGDQHQAAGTDVPSGQTVAPPLEIPPEAPNLEEQIDQVSAPAAASQVETPSSGPGHVAPPPPVSTPPAERKAQTTWPPIKDSGPAESEPATVPSGGQGQPAVADQPRGPEPPLPREAGRPPVIPKPVLPSGSQLPQDLLAYLILIDIGGEMRHARQIPQYFQIQRLRTLAGRHARAHIHLDDEVTVRPEHARIIYQEKDGRWFFTIHSLSPGAVTVNETPVGEGGVVLKSGDLVGIGSAKLVFFMKSLKDEDL